MARKRAAILDAARDAFLRDGYEGSSMEGIAAAAGVSIMTLYRHAESKDDLFAAVIAGACYPTDEAQQRKVAELLQKPLEEMLVFAAVLLQDRLASPQTTALLRAVMVETARFPQLAVMTYRGLIGTHEEMLDAFLSERDETAGIDPAQRRKLGAAFINRLVGVDNLRVLLGLTGATAQERRARARQAANELLAALDASRPVSSAKSKKSKLKIRPRSGATR